MLAKLGAKLSAYLFTVFLHVSEILLFGKTPGPRDKHATSRPLKTVPSMQSKDYRI